MSPLDIFPKNIVSVIRVIAGFLLLVAICCNPIADAIFRGISMKK